MNKCLASNSNAMSSYNKLMQSKNSTYNVPKQKILVKVNSAADSYTREIIANGIKSLPPRLPHPI